VSIYRIPVAPPEPPEHRRLRRERDALRARIGEAQAELLRRYRHRTIRRVAFVLGFLAALEAATFVAASFIPT
jgi:hypothetical protein